MGKRTAHKAKTKYEETWNEALAIVEQDISQGNKNLLEILANYSKFKTRDRLNNKFFNDVSQTLDIAPKGKRPQEKQLVVLDNKYTIIPLDCILDDIFIDILAKFIHEEEKQIDYIVELGSGFGINLFNLAYKLDPNLRKRVKFFSCEYTDSGKQTCERLLGLSNELQMSIEHFDYYHPDFSFILPKKNILFFTAHSIEQIPILDQNVFKIMLDVSNQCHCYHAEPIGWQFDETLRIEREDINAKDGKRDKSHLRKSLLKIDRWIFTKLGIGIVDTSKQHGIKVEKNDIGKPDKVSANAVSWSSARDYNTNLLSILKQLERDGLIRIDSEIVNHYGKNPFNPTSIISWHKIKD